MAHVKDAKVGKGGLVIWDGPLVSKEWVWSAGVLGETAPAVAGRRRALVLSGWAR